MTWYRCTLEHFDGETRYTLNQLKDWPSTPSVSGNWSILSDAAVQARRVLGEHASLSDITGQEYITYPMVFQGDVEFSATVNISGTINFTTNILEFGDGANTIDKVIRIDTGEGTLPTLTYTVATDTWTFLDDIDVTGTVTATTFLGDLNGTINTLTTAATQTPGTNSTLVATTAYVDAAVLVEDLWDRTTGPPNYVLPSTAADDIGATGARITKVWATDVDVATSLVAGGDAVINTLTVGLGSGSVADNTAAGFEALLDNTTGSKNTVVGYQSAFNNTTGANNTAVGYKALFINTIGVDNTAIGGDALHDNTEGNGNVAVGESALQKNTTGGQNLAVGNNALAINTTGDSNTACGHDALSSLTASGFNTATGRRALFFTTGADNTAIGYQALYGNTTGADNTAIGYRAGRYITGGSVANETSGTSVYLGTDTKASADGNANEIVVGYDTTGNGTNTATWGNTSMTAHHFTGTINATTYVGDLSGTINTATTATTQTPGTNSTLVATTAYVDAAVLVEDLWDRTTGGTNYVLPSTAADDIGATGARITKVWATDVDATTYVGDLNGTINTATTATTQTPSTNSTLVATTAYVDAAVLVEDLWDRTTGGTNYVLPSTAADDIGATGARITKVWATDVDATTYVGDLNGTINTATTATTQTPGTNSTLVATTAYVDAAVLVEDLWDRTTGGTNYVLPSTAADDIGATGARITKVWATDIDVGTDIVVGGTVDGIDSATDVGANTTHRTSDGSDHSFLDQAVTIAGTPTFATLNLSLNDAVTNAASTLATLTHTTSGAASIGIGTGINLVTETSAGNNEIGVVIEAIATELTSTDEIFALVLKTMTGGEAATESLRVASAATTVTGELSVKLPANSNYISAKDAGDGNLVQIGSDASGNGEIKIFNSSHAEIQQIGVGAVSYSSLWYHGTADAITVSQSEFAEITSFDNVGEEDSQSNAVGDPVTNKDITIGADAAGVYTISISASLTVAGGASREIYVVPKIMLATPKTITDATNATPIVVTSEDHGFRNGDMISQSGVVTNTAANGDFTLTSVTADTYALQNLEHANVAGNGAYGGGGTVDSVYPGNILIERIVSQTDLGRGADSDTYALAAGDVVRGAVANTDSADNPSFTQITMSLVRIA